MSKPREFRRIYIRHADKEYANGDAAMYKHDPGITDNGVEKTKMVARHLIEQWGNPDSIIVSPYRRTRETAQIMNSVLNKKVKVKIDIELSEYLGNHRNIPIDVTERTKVHDPPHPETFSDMKGRVRKHHHRITNFSKQQKDGGVVWIITHGLIIKQVASLIGIKMAKEFPTLTCLSIVDGEKITKSEVTIFNENLDSLDSEQENSEQENSDSLESEDGEQEQNSDSLEE